MSTKLLILLALCFAALSSGAQAQELAGCTAEEAANPPRVIYRCEGGLTIEAEEGTGLAALAGGGGPQPAAIEVGSKAVLIDIAPGRGEFQVLTPHAIASVRGTVYAVDVAAESTAVFVSEGVVGVARRDSTDDVQLAAGEGVDVKPGEPLEVKTWGQGRVDALLARFGR
ncbi:FecR domain-containing protein [Afifella sp. IM 167]|uniref:FecR domain-containing protein n=1 Tax=Afifella sp. IM 167 TaxID=2033586 RepID=UPI001CCA06D7|nr:FecR domain-containing protein [Afifella sp. IM 167]MBZ8134965.1 hypothetical protein [Afifella sp. IM 167]